MSDHFGTCIKELNLGQQDPYLDIGLKLEKNCCHVFNQHSQICPNAKIRSKQESKYGLKNALWVILGVVLKKLLYLKSAPWNLSKINF